MKMPKHDRATRASLTRDELQRLSVTERSRLKLAEDELKLLRNINEERVWQERTVRLRIEQSGLIKEIQDAGAPTTSLYDLINGSKGIE